MEMAVDMGSEIKRPQPGNLKYFEFLGFAFSCLQFLIMLVSYNRRVTAKTMVHGAADAAWGAASRVMGLAQGAVTGAFFHDVATTRVGSTRVETQALARVLEQAA
ncbi:hypothetical protein Tco_0594202 [Tanacetum coccineum]